MMAIITPSTIPVNFFGSGKTSNLTYEFYNPSALAHQLAFGQLPIALCYADMIKPREIITSNLEWIRIAQLPPNSNTDVDLSAWIPALFITQAYKQWWEEWKEHLFCRSALTYRGMIDPKYKVPDNTVSTLNQCFNPFTFTLPSVTYFLCCMQVDDTPPLASRSGRPIELLPSGPISLIGNNAKNLGCYNASGCESQESHHQTNENIPIGGCHYFGISLQGKFSGPSTYTDSILILTQFFRIHRLVWELHR